MTDYAIIFDVATGAHHGNYMGPDNTAVSQKLPDGAAYMLVPVNAWTTPPNLPPIKDHAASLVDMDAETQRQTLITGGSGQAMTYMAKNAEALGYLANNAYPTPFLSAEAAAIGSTVAALAAEVRDAAIAWQAAGAAIEAKRRKAKVDIAAATNVAEIHAAMQVDWSANT